MDNEKMNEIKKKLADTLKKEEIQDPKTGYYTYLMFGSFTHPNYTELPEGQDEKLSELLYLVSHNFVDILDERFENGMPEDFDLFLICSQSASIILEQEEVEGDTHFIMEMLLTAFAATFRMWFERVNNDDILAFFEDREHGELPSMVDSSVTFAWAVDKGIPCSDMRSLFETLGSIKNPGDEPGVYEAMGDICKMFDVLVPTFVEEGIPQQFIDDNILVCRNVFMSAQLFFHMMPVSVDAKKEIQDDERINHFYDCFIETLAGPEMLKQMKGNENSPHFRHIFKVGLMVAVMLDANNSEDHTSLYEEATKTMAKKYTDRQSKTE